LRAPIVRTFSRPKLLDVNDVMEIQRAGRLESRDRAPPVFSLLTRLAVVIVAAKSDGVGSTSVVLPNAAEPGSHRP
jgi:hypothetical protein